MTYLYRIVQPGEQRPDGLSEGTGVFVDCDNRGRREGVDMRKPYAPVASFGASAVEELEFACRWASEQPKYKEYANSYWGRAQSKPQSPTVVPPASQAPQARPPEATRPKPPATHVASAGSGFIVSQDHVVTNHHVIKDCAKVSVRFGALTSPALVVASTSRNDLALLASTNNAAIPVAIRASASLGEDLTVAGFPLSGLLSNDIIVTSGQVNSMAGLGNDPTMLQISAPVQPGNSGGPLLDRSGSVVGVVVSKLNVERLAKVTGDLAQNVNFAIKPEVLRLFLDTNRVKYRTAAMGQRLDGTVLAERARQFTVQVLCEE